jgi:uncharacterized protein YciI
VVDKPGSAAIRAKLRKEHMDYLKSMDAMCFFTGPLLADDGVTMVGSVWIVSAGSRAEAQAFLEGEAFYKAGIFESVRINRLRTGGHFHPALADAGR